MWTWQLNVLYGAQVGEESDIVKLTKVLEDEARQKKKLEEEVIILQSQLLQLTLEAEQVRVIHNNITEPIIWKYFKFISCVEQHDIDCILHLIERF